MKASEAIRAISSKLMDAYAGRINVTNVISVYGPVVYAQYDEGAKTPIRVCIEEGPSISDRFTLNLDEVPDRNYLLADLFKAIVPSVTTLLREGRIPVRKAPLKCRVVNW